MSETEQGAGEAAAPTITLDLSTLTLGEMSNAEIASGQDFDRLLRGRVSRRLLALWVHEQRTSERPRSWRELASLRLSDVGSSTSPLPSDGPSAKSSD